MAERINRDRGAKNPGGMQCQKCDEIFIGEEWHILCGVCVKMRDPSQPRHHMSEAPVQWRAFYNVTYPKLWGIETTDPRAVDAGLEILVAPCMPEHAAKTLSEEYNSAAAAVSDLTKDRKSKS